MIGAGDFVNREGGSLKIIESVDDVVSVKYLHILALFLLNNFYNMNRKRSARKQLRKLSVWGIKIHRSAAVRRGPRRVRTPRPLNSLVHRVLVTQFC